MEWPTKINIRTLHIKRIEANVQSNRLLQIFGGKIDKQNVGGNMPHLADVRFADASGT